MAKRKIKVNIDDRIIVAPVWELDTMAWQETRLGCPYCGIFSPISPMMDVIQFGLENNDSVHTIIQCAYCVKLYAIHYVNTQEVVE